MTQFDMDDKRKRLQYINVAVVKQLIEDVGRENAHSLLPLFCDELKQHLSILNHQPSLLIIEEISHSFKSSAASFGAEVLAAIAQEFEQKANKKDADWIDLHLIRYLKIITYTLTDMEQLLVDNKLLDSLF